MEVPALLRASFEGIKSPNRKSCRSNLFIKMPRKQEVIKLSLKESDQNSLREMAQKLGILHGENPSISKLIAEIAQEKISLATPVSKATQRAIAWATIAAQDKGAWAEALALGDLLESLPSMDLQIAEDAITKLKPLKQGWAKDIFSAIDQQQPFKLAYQDAAGRPFQFSACGAKFVAHEHRTYLDCWCLETEGNQDIPQLQHNWCLRLDRITDAEIIPLKKKWRSLDTVEIEMDFSGGLAHAYEPRAEDTLIEWVKGDRKRVKRSITSSFWFVREILQYGKDCQVIAPPAIRDRIHHQLTEAARQYE